MMYQKRKGIQILKKENIVEKTLKLVATITSESSSWIGFYEPKIPEKLCRNDESKK